MTDIPETALIVAHGQPSDPAPAAAEIAALAAKVAAHLPGWQVGSATLAEAEALPQGIAAAGRPGLIYPLFMAGGWFTRTLLPKRLAEAGGADWRIAEPFGTDPAIAALTVTLAREALERRPEGAREILLAAHGSSRSPAPSDIAIAMAARLREELGLDRCEAAFIDQSPQIVHVAATMPDALCLPFFAARGGHVIDDLPQALAEAGFRGPLLPPVGLDDRVPGLIAAALRAALAPVAS
ncbi:MAG: Cobalamin [Cereibacter sp.]|jgi:sirohydrochlorin ferrochelatase|nr:Cobalamin [Cereibacter sp.]